MAPSEPRCSDDPDLLGTYDYELPEGRIAAEPADRRDASRLLVHHRAEGRTEHTRFEHLGRHLTAGDLLVINRTKVIPARLSARRASGGHVEVMVEPIAGTPIAAAPGRARALLRPSARVRAGEELTLDSGHVLRVEDPPGGELRAISFEVSLAELVEGGLMPLPPYIERHGPDDRRALDRERYQTVYARDPGAIAAPTAGLHFTPELLARLEQQGVEIAALTLHVGAGTFLPVRTERLSEHPMHAERFEIAAETSARIAATRARGGRVIAVGTTTTRALEAAVDREGRVAVGAAETRLLIQPGHRFGVIDGLITNFHLPRSTLLALVAAFAGLERIRELYARAIEEGYRFYSYGDAMLLL